jgi:hypothetical protein
MSAQEKPEVLSLYEFFKKFPDEEAARTFFELSVGQMANTARIVEVSVLLNAKITNQCHTDAKIAESTLA